MMDKVVLHPVLELVGSEPLNYSLDPLTMV